MPSKPPVGEPTTDELRHLHARRLTWLEQVEGRIVALPTEYPDGYRVPFHSHSRAQLLHALTGVVMVTTDEGRWMVPPEHAMWIPAGVDHSVEMHGTGQHALGLCTCRAPSRACRTACAWSASRNLMRSLIVELGNSGMTPIRQAAPGW